MISRAEIVGGHDGRAEILVELTYDNGGTTTISLDEDACLASLDDAGVDSIDDLVGRDWTVVLPALRTAVAPSRPGSHPHDRSPSTAPPSTSHPGAHHVRPRHP